MAIGGSVLCHAPIIVMALHSYGHRGECVQVSAEFVQLYRQYTLAQAEEREVWAHALKQWGTAWLSSGGPRG